MDCRTWSIAPVAPPNWCGIIAMACKFDAATLMNWRDNWNV